MSGYETIIKNGTLMTPQGPVKKDLALRHSKIAALLDPGHEEFAPEIIDATNLHVLPGIIDSQVHFREPGLDHKEDLHTGSKSAALGGVTTFLEMPNTNPPTIDAESIAYKVARGRETSFTNFGFFMGATENNLENLLAASEVEGCCGIKIFLGSSTGSLLLYDKEKLTKIFESCSLPIALHSENELMLRERRPIRDAAKDVHAHYDWRNVDTALSSTQMILDLARETGKRVHVLHISTKEEMELLATYQDVATVEVTPQHLTLSAPEDYDRLGTYAQMNPPIRSADHRDGLWEGLTNGTVDVIGSDHAPHLKEEKDKGYPNSPSGMPGVQTILTIMLDHVNQGRLTLEKLVNLLCLRPAELYSLRNKGKLAIGYDADITIVDMNKTHTIANGEQASKCGWTPYDGKKVKGFPVRTIVHGHTVMDNGELVGSPMGQPICR